ncbi:SMI1/KNR4 family protein [Corallincola luteus]|nr:SMI1/KNR4 family protein [Corallincola luteus]
MTTWNDLTNKIESKFPTFLGALSAPTDTNALNEISALIETSLPETFLNIYRHSDGEKLRATGYVFGLSLLSTEKIVHELKGWRDVIDQGLDGLSDSCTSHQEGKIKCEYANTKWLPLLGDWSGNFIGLDFDPGPEGKQGQVINFGRDEEHKYVFADSLDEFMDLLDRLLESAEITIDEEGGYAYQETHFIDALKELATQ